MELLSSSPDAVSGRVATAVTLQLDRAIFGNLPPDGNAYCGIANQGPIYKPHVLKSINARAKIALLLKV